MTKSYQIYVVEGGSIACSYYSRANDAIPRYNELEKQILEAVFLVDDGPGGQRPRRVVQACGDPESMLWGLKTLLGLE